MTPEQAREYAKPIVDIYTDLTDQLMINIAKRLSTDRILTSTAQWEVVKLAQLGALTKDNIKTIARYTDGSKGMVEASLLNAAHAALETIEEPLHDALIAGALGNVDVVPASKSVAKVLTAYQKQAETSLNLVNTVMTYKAKDAYTGLVHRAATLANSDEYLYLLGKNTASVLTGAQSRTAALRQCIREFSEKGIPGFVDAAGREWSPEAYINMDIRTIVNNVANDIQFERMDEYGSDLIEVSSHVGARPRCAPYQGRLFSRSGKSGYTTDLNDAKVFYSSWASTSYGEAAGLLGINCGHQVYPFFPGLSRQTYHPYAEPENNQKYNESQGQRYHERQVKKSKRECAMLDAMGDKEGFQKASTLLKQREAALKNYCAGTGRAYKSDRVQVTGFGHGLSSKAAAANKGFNQNATELGYNKKADTRNSKNNVDLKNIRSEEYRRKFDNATDNTAVNQALYEQSKAMLTHRNGTDYENLALINSRTGEVMKLENKRCKDFAVCYSEKTLDIVDANKYNLIAIHNHPTNLPPTGSDFVSAGQKCYKSGVVACHNGDVFMYEVGNRVFTSSFFGEIVDSFKEKGYNNYDATIKTLERLKSTHGIKWSKL